MRVCVCVCVCVTQEMKISEGQQQWWTFKAKNFDSVLLFKMGKFYEVCIRNIYRTVLYCCEDTHAHPSLCASCCPVHCSGLSDLSA